MGAGLARSYGPLVRSIEVRDIRFLSPTGIFTQGYGVAEVDPRYRKPPQDDPAVSQAAESELDDLGRPVQSRSAKSRTYLYAFACFICGAACFGLALLDYNGDAKSRLTGYQTALALLPGILAFVLTVVLEQKKNEKQLGVVGKGMMWAGPWLAIFGVIGLGVFTWHWSP